ncbi:E3 ubiquitin-protein ligase HOS1 [Camellia lanceoleosa]|uniref:E3 ubiquitin-protein ligase HOS1 n=1 Tax=Camellia lanceoleosa TaxID=1840588 RepID=A0ACC0I1B1_9ERIC|nr:E3 ubiquitin-protein ligase HOS1 [Camellia lanceoleosa]
MRTLAREEMKEPLREILVREQIQKVKKNFHSHACCPPQMLVSLPRASDLLFASSIKTLRLHKEALEHLASIDLIELCNEAKVECCRATRDLRSCGRYVESVLNSCGHASLCIECCRYDSCPICRIPIPKNGNVLRLRLYYECIEFSLTEGPTDVTDVCLDESAVSSDPVIAFLLDEVVVKDWCKRRFKNILAELQGLWVFLSLSVPVLYEKYQDQIDEKLIVARKIIQTQFRKIDDNIMRKLPLPLNKEKKTQ